MTRAGSLERKLLSISEELRRRGQDDLASDLGEIVDDLTQEGTHGGAQASTDRLLTTGEAARALGVRSINTVKRWAAEGSLDAVRRGGRLLISMSSVRRMLESSQVADQRSREARISQALEPFDAGDEVPPSTQTWEGRKPWGDRDRASA